jgi:hypothetical protein
MGERPKREDDKDASNEKTERSIAPDLMAFGAREALVRVALHVCSKGKDRVLSGALPEMSRDCSGGQSVVEMPQKGPQFVEFRKAAGTLD